MPPPTQSAYRSLGDVLGTCRKLRSQGLVSRSLPTTKFRDLAALTLLCYSPRKLQALQGQEYIFRALNVFKYLFAPFWYYDDYFLSYINSINPPHNFGVITYCSVTKIGSE